MTTSHQHPPVPTAAEVGDMTLEERARLAGTLDDVDVVHNQRKWPLSGTRAEKRAERSVALWFVISAVSGPRHRRLRRARRPGLLGAEEQPVSGLASEPISQCALRPARELAGAPWAQRPAKPPEPRGRVVGGAGGVGKNSEAVR
jgi:hypothetical protein